MIEKTVKAIFVSIGLICLYSSIYVKTQGFFESAVILGIYAIAMFTLASTVD